MPRTPLAGLAGVAGQASAGAGGAVAHAAAAALGQLVCRVAVGLVKGGAVVIRQRECVRVAGGDLAQRQRGTALGGIPPEEDARVGDAARRVRVGERARRRLGGARGQAGLGLEQRVAGKLPGKGAPHAGVVARRHDLDDQRRVTARAQEGRRPRGRVEAHAQLGHRGAGAAARRKDRRAQCRHAAADVGKGHAHGTRACRGASWGAGEGRVRMHAQAGGAVALGATRARRRRRRAPPPPPPPPRAHARWEQSAPV